MKITARAVQASFEITNEAGEVVASCSVENATFTTDISGLLSCVSQAAHLFKQLDAQHNEQSSAAPATKPVSSRVGVLERTPQAQELINAVRRFKARTNGVSVELSTEQHDSFMSLADALTDACDDANARNVKLLAERAKAYMALFDASKYVTVRSRLVEAIAAI